MRTAAMNNDDALVCPHVPSMSRSFCVPCSIVRGLHKHGEQASGLDSQPAVGFADLCRLSFPGAETESVSARQGQQYRCSTAHKKCSLRNRGLVQHRRSRPWPEARKGFVGAGTEVEKVHGQTPRDWWLVSTCNPKVGSLSPGRAF